MASGYIDLTLGEKALTSFQDIDMSEYAQHLKEKQKEWNSAFKEHESTKDLRFCAKDSIKIAKQMPHMLMGRVPVVEWLKGDQEGTVWDTQIRTTVDILNSTLVNPGQSGVCIGPTMCGKTGTANNCQFIAPVLSMMTGIPHLMINLLPNKKSIEDQAKDDWLFPDDGATVEVVTSLDSRVMPLPKDDLVYHERMGSGVDKTIEEAFKESPKEYSGLVLHSSQASAKPEAPKSLAPAPEDQEVLDF